MSFQFIAAILTAAKRFPGATRGNIAMMFAIGSIPMILAIGGGIDYSRATVARTQMQDALDATSLALSRQKTLGTMTGAQMMTFSTNYFNANFTNTDLDAAGVTLVPSYASAGPSVTIGGSGKVTMAFLGLIGITKIPITATSTTIWGQSRLRIALVLDNTGSMSSANKMSALKTATHALLTQLQNAVTTPGDVYASIIPFARDVNAGASNYGQTWVRWDLWNEVNGTCSRTTYTTKTTCANASRTWTAANHNTWNGCLTDRDQNNDTTNTAPSTGTAATLFPADQYSACPQQLLALTYDWAALSSKVDAMQPNGSTNQAIGLQMGWQSLSASPFTIPTETAPYKYKKIIILLSDGLNTQDRWYGDGVNPAPQVDARQAILCTNVKATGVIVYAVQVNTGGDPTSTLLQNCASEPGDFFLLTTAGEIVTTFEAIGTALSDLRLKG